MGRVQLQFLDEMPAGDLILAPGAIDALFAPPPPSLGAVAVSGSVAHAATHGNTANATPPTSPPMTSEGGTSIALQIYCCRNCKAHLSASGLILSKAYQASTGSAYLFERIYNCRLGESVGRIMNTGYHVVCDIFCDLCDAQVGWKYVHAQHASQAFKEGKFILELALLSIAPYATGWPTITSSASSSETSSETSDDTPSR